MVRVQLKYMGRMVTYSWVFDWIGGFRCLLLRDRLGWTVVFGVGVWLGSFGSAI